MGGKEGIGGKGYLGELFFFFRGGEGLEGIEVFGLGRWAEGNFLEFIKYIMCILRNTVQDNE